MKCPICGKETPDNTVKCIHCGANLIGKAQITPKFSQSHDEKPPLPGKKESRISSIDAGTKTEVVQKSSREQPGTTPQAKQNQSEVSENDKDKESSDEEETLRKALIGRYEIIRKLGSGGMANVYLAREIALDREVAIKLLPQSFLRNEQFIQRFKREAQVAANLEHPHIVRIYRIAEEKNLCYFVMSYIPGGTITDQIKKKWPIPIADIVQWGMDVCSALGYAHDNGVIHRDLKPDNIMLDKGRRAVVMDYGIARASQGTGLTQTGSIIGTPQFMSPEQARGIDLDARSDIYSMGLVLYQMATATLPFQAHDAASLMYMHVHETPESPDVRNTNVPAWLRDIILKCLAKNPDDRFGHAKELRLALAEHKAPELTLKTRVERKRVKERKRTGLFVGIAAIIAVAAFAGWFMWNSRQSPVEQISLQTSVQSQKPAQEQLTTLSPQSQINPDDLAYQQAEMINSKQAFSTYLEKYPEGKHVEEARGKVTAFEKQEQEEARLKEQITQQQQQEQIRIEEERRDEMLRQQEEAVSQDDQSFQQARMNDTQKAYSAYLEFFPNGSHVAEARERIAVIEREEIEHQQEAAEEQARKDDEGFRLAENTNTIESYAAYLISFPNGRHFDEAERQQSAIKKLQAFEEKIKVALTGMSINMIEVSAGSFQMGSNNGGTE